ncbi:MAG: TetR/AcrR family transcriptional regulator [Gammaproteobacteria bacterium]|jgi:AcrR family transcriptional regulator|tara:strand:- start:4508 stop:5083 length:576 start_codon:yes stop_codon:yes gene_type:complete
MNKLKKDGRKLRSESTSDHILNTAIKIARKGNIDSMSFNSIAKEADIGTRTIFRHFKDQESLQDSLDQKLGEEFTSYFSKINKEDNLETRIENLSSTLIQFYVKNQNIIRWTLRNVWRDKNLRQNMFSWNQILRNFVYSILPEIQEKKKSEREIIFECMSFLFFLRLIVVQGLNHEQIKDIFILNTKKYLS